MAAVENFTCVKYLMIAFNFVFWLIGCAVIGVGIWIRVDPNFSKVIDQADTSNFLYIAAYVLIAIGVIIMLIGFLGCCGAIRESQCMLVTFFIFLFIIFVALVAVGIWALASKSTLQDVVGKAMDDAVKNYKNNAASKTFMDAVQSFLECCGASKGKADYGIVTDIPDSCKSAVSGSYWVKQCPTALFEFFSANLVIIGGVAVALGCIMLFGMIFSCCMFCAIKNRG